MKIKVTLSIGLVGKQEETIEVDDDEFDGLSGDALDEKLNEYWLDWAWNYIDGCAEIEE